MKLILTNQYRKATEMNKVNLKTKEDTKDETQTLKVKRCQSRGKKLLQSDTGQQHHQIQLSAMTAIFLSVWSKQLYGW